MSPKKFVANPRERVDSEAVGMAALEKSKTKIYKLKRRVKEVRR